MSIRSSLRTLLAASACAAAALSMAQSHVYDFNGSLADSKGGPSLTAEGGTLTGGRYVFAANQGLGLSGVVGSTYTVELGFEFDQTDGYRKILDFKDRGSDAGLYNLNGQLYFFNFGGNTSTAVFQANKDAHVILTRDNATDTVKAYANGLLLQTFTDSGDAAVPTSILRFFRDDSAQNYEASGGSVDFIKIYDSALSEANAKAISAQPVPEPATMAVLGLGLLGVARRRRR